jgi:hypothetical protein
VPDVPGLAHTNLWAWYNRDGLRMTVTNWATLFSAECWAVHQIAMTPMQARHITVGVVCSQVAPDGPSREELADAMGHSPAQQAKAYDLNRQHRNSQVHPSSHHHHHHHHHLLGSHPGDTQSHLPAATCTCSLFLPSPHCSELPMSPSPDFLIACALQAAHDAMAAFRHGIRNMPAQPPVAAPIAHRGSTSYPAQPQQQPQPRQQQQQQPQPQPSQQFSCCGDSSDDEVDTCTVTIGGDSDSDDDWDDPPAPPKREKKLRKHTHRLSLSSM